MMELSPSIVSKLCGVCAVYPPQILNVRLDANKIQCVKKTFISFTYNVCLKKGLDQLLFTARCIDSVYNVTISLSKPYLGTAILTFFFKPSFHSVYYKGIMPRFVRAKTWFFGIILCISLSNYFYCHLRKCCLTLVPDWRTYWWKGGLTHRQTDWLILIILYYRLLMFGWQHFSFPNQTIVVVHEIKGKWN